MQMASDEFCPVPLVRAKKLVGIGSGFRRGLQSGTALWQRGFKLANLGCRLSLIRPNIIDWACGAISPLKIGACIVGVKDGEPTFEPS